MRPILFSISFNLLDREICTMGGFLKKCSTEYFLWNAKCLQISPIISLLGSSRLGNSLSGPKNDQKHNLVNLSNATKSDRNPDILSSLSRIFSFLEKTIKNRFKNYQKLFYSFLVLVFISF